jgi:hypothetical protein
VQKTGPICCLTPQIWGDPKIVTDGVFTLPKARGYGEGVTSVI